MTTPKIQLVTCDGWWTATIKLEGHTLHTQGRNLQELHTMIKDALKIASEDPDLPTPKEEIEIEYDPTITAAIDAYKQASKAKQEAEKHLHEISRTTVKTLRNLGLTLQDIGDLLGLTKGRIHQLTKQ